MSAFDFALGSEYVIEDPTMLITESVEDCTFLEDVFAEGTTKKNIFSKLWGALKHFIGVIAAKCRQIGSWISAIFHTKKVDDKILDDIAAEALGEVEEVPGSKQLKLRYTNDQKIQMTLLGSMVSAAVKPTEINGHDPKDRPKQKMTALAFNIVKNPSILDPIIDFVNACRNKNTDGYDVSRVQKAIDACWAETMVGITIMISLEQWTTLNERVQKLQNALQVVVEDTLSGDEFYDKKYVEQMNQIVHIANYFQVGLNAIADTMRMVYELDPKYHDKITKDNFRVALPKFVSKCIASNIPGKYISHAVRQICDVSINGDPSNPSKKADDNKYLKGNGRFVIIPGDESLQNYVIKVAYNQLGVRGNKTEFMVWNRVKDIQEIADELYHIEDINDPENCVILCDRVKEIEKWDGAEEWNKKMRELCAKHNLGFIIHCNAGGFGKRPDGKTICVDYGNVRRSGTAAPAAPSAS